MPIPRSVAIPKTWKTFNFGSAFAAFIYPALGLIVLGVAIGLGIGLENLSLKWSYLGWALFAAALSLLICNLGIGPMHRVLQHRAGEFRIPGQVFVMLNCIIAMQGDVKSWINYHSQHHRFADKAGDPHNPFESKAWAWVGWVLFRDQKDMERPTPLWLKENRVVIWMNERYNGLSIIVHLIIPAAIYAIVWLAGGSLLLTALLHASVVLARGLHFHATTLGINVLGHLKTPIWLDHIMALLTGGEAFHDHHHDEPQSALHRPRKGVWNRIVDYNGTALLVMEKLRLVKNLKIAPQFA